MPKKSEIPMDLQGKVKGCMRPIKKFSLLCCIIPDNLLTLPNIK